MVFLRRVTSQLRRVWNAWKRGKNRSITFYPRKSQVQGLDKLPEEVQQAVLDKIASDDVEAFLRCGGSFRPDDWFALSHKEAMLIAKVASKIETERNKILAGVVGNTTLLTVMEEIEEGRFDLRWKLLVDEEMRIIDREHS